MARRKQETLVLFPDVYTNTRKMSDEQFGALMRAVFAYRFSGEVYTGDDLAVDVVFCMVKLQLDRYNEICQINHANRIAIEEENEMQRNATKCNEVQRNTPHTHTHIHTHTRNHTHTRIEERECVSAQPPPPTCFLPCLVDKTRRYCTSTGHFALSA